MLIAMAGSAEGARAIALGMVSDCQKSRRPNEAAYWRAVARAVVWVDNPQPLIAPEGPREVGMSRRGATVHRVDFAGRLPRQRKRVLQLMEKVRAILERAASETPDKPDRER